MSCYHPQWRIDYEKAKFWLPQQYEKRVHNGGILISRAEADYLKVKAGPFAETSIGQIQCGKCIGCRLNKSREWADRCMLESKSYEHNCFITLTLDTPYLTFSPYVDVDTGETALYPMLLKNHLQQFMKSLRQRFSRNFEHVGIRYYGCGEYGEIHRRPHYHAILFNCDFPDRKFYQERPGGRIYTSDILSSVWGKGLCSVADVTWETCAYVARYVTKKRLGLARKEQVEAQEMFFPDDPWQDEFTLMSNKPGIGRDFYEAHKSEIYATDELIVRKNGSSVPVKPCTYYDRLYDLEYPEDMESIKLKRRIKADNVNLARISQTDLTEVEYLESQERAKIRQSERLIRPLGDD